MKVAIAGCLHGELDKLYAEIVKQGQKVDLVLVCGDFQAIRNENDFSCIHVPPKYQRLGTFYQYYFGIKKAPTLTIIIGGNHEASNYFQTLPYGGWIAPNMYYMGYASVVNFGGLRIGGLSGIYGKFHNDRYRHDNLGHYEKLPYDKDQTVSAYHMRQTEVYKMLQLKRHPDGDFRPVLDVLLSHDWPLNIHRFGNVGYLLNKKPFFRDEVNAGTLGNPLLLPLLEHIKPTNWFAGHLHVGFNAVVDHYRCSNVRPEAGSKPSKTEFQALHKTGFYFVQIRDIKVENEPEEKKLEYDAEWLAIIKKTSHLFRVTRQPINDYQWDKWNDVQVSEEDIAQVKEAFGNDLTIVEDFAPCDPVPEQNKDLDPRREKNFLNPQTTRLCEKLSVPDPNQLIIDQDTSRINDLGPLKIVSDAPKVKNPDEIDLDDSDEEECCQASPIKKPKIDTAQTDLYSVPEDQNKEDTTKGDTPACVPGLYFEDV